LKISCSFKRVWLLLLLFVVVLSISPRTAHAEKIDDILKAGVIRIGVGLTGPPSGGRDASGNPIGYDPDVARLVGEALGVEVEFVEVTGQNRIPMLLSDKIDIILCTMTGNTERAKTMNFSIPYLRAGVKILVRNDSSVKDIADLDDPSKKAAVGRGTTGELLMKKLAPKAELLYTEEVTSQVLMVKQGKADAALEDSILIDYIASRDGELLSLPKQYTSDPLCIGVAKGDLDFVRWLDMFVSNFISSGQQGELYKKWWGVEYTGDFVTPW
jgi:polar amino acid transport system substrate-binding protein